MTDPHVHKPKVRAMQYERRGSVLAIAPKAFFETFFMYEEPARENTEIGDAVIVDIREPLEQHAHPYYDSYEDIERRVALACESSARAVILRFDSPGGEAAGCFDTAREIRRKCDAAGKELHAFVEADCCSAAYALAAVCTTITVGETSLTGSIGTLVCRDDYSAQNTARGIRVAYITSGARKADGHPDSPITDAELAALQSIVDELGEVFFDHVANTRGLAPITVQQMEARIMTAHQAVAAGLADQVGSLSDVLARVAGSLEGISTMANAYEKAVASLEEAAKGDDANAAAAKRALAALGGTDGDKPPAEPDKTPDDEPKPDNAGDPPATTDDDDKKKKDSPAAVAAMRAALAAQRDATAARLELKAMREDAERSRLIASRPGMAPEMVALLQRAPIELVREHIAALPEQPINPTLAEKPKVGATAGASSHGLGLPPDEKRKLDIQMGLIPRTPGDESTDTKLVLGGRSARLQQQQTEPKAN